MEQRNSDFFADLHCHLYGALRFEDLLWLYNRKKPRYQIWTESLKMNRKVLKSGSDIDRIFSFVTHPREREKLLKDYYYLESPENFDLFQSRFDLVIALSHTDPEELEYIADSVIRFSDADYTEYRMFLPPRYNEKEFEDRLHALTGVFKVFSKSASLALSLPRQEKEALLLYSWILNYTEKNPERAECITGIDISGKEEGSPPSSLSGFLNQFKEDRSAGRHNLNLMYHAGESFNDKTPESAVRWIYEAALAGADRIGHALALGLHPHIFLNTERKESDSERKAQLQFEKENRESLKKFGYSDITSQSDRETILYTQQRADNLMAVQEFTISKLNKLGTVIESCPTSNLLIAGLGTAADHPLKRFTESGLRTVIGSDDPGILKTSLKKEFSIIQKWDGITPEITWKLKKEAAALVKKVL